MFELLRRRGMRRPSPAIRRALAARPLPPGVDAAELGVVQRPGTYAGRDVTFIRIFDPARAARRAVDVFGAHTYDDLNAHLDLVLGAGRIEPDGAVILDEPRHLDDPARQRAAEDPCVPGRVPADGAARAGDERCVSPNADAARAGPIVMHADVASVGGSRAAAAPRREPIPGRKEAERGR